jgi:hypothetical protein
MQALSIVFIKYGIIGKNGQILKRPVFSWMLRFCSAVSALGKRVALRLRKMLSSAVKRKNYIILILKDK